MDAVQAAKLLTPLFAARAMAPALPEVYELIADVWLHCAVQPERGHLAVLTEGIHLFPRRPVLVYRTAELCAARGFAAEATELVRLGLKIATDEADRARFTALQEKLASTADPAPPK